MGLGAWCRPQSLFVVALFTGGKKSILRRVLDTATFLPVAARESLTAYMDQQRAQFDPNAPHDASTVRFPCTRRSQGGGVTHRCLFAERFNRPTGGQGMARHDL